MDEFTKLIANYLRVKGKETAKRALTDKLRQALSRNDFVEAKRVFELTMEFYSHIDGLKEALSEILVGKLENLVRAEQYEKVALVLSMLDKVNPETVKELDFVKVRPFILRIKDIVLQFFKILDTVKREARILCAGIAEGTAEIRLIPKTQLVPSQTRGAGASLDEVRATDPQFARLEIEGDTYDIHWDSRNSQIIVQGEAPDAIELEDRDGAPQKKEKLLGDTIFQISKD